MHTLFFPNHKLLGTSFLPRPMALSLTFSLLLHATTFAFSYRWLLSSPPKVEQAVPVELVELPERTESKEAVEIESPHAGDKAKAKLNEPLSPIRPTYPSMPALTNYDVSSLPSREELDPPSPSEKEATVSLDSQESRYLSYLSKIKKKIEPKWHYPEIAQKIGLQGRLILSFTISQEGYLRRIKLLNSSGHPLLDEGAIQAVRDAAPYDPLPERLKITRLNINATFEYRISPFSRYRLPGETREENL